MDRTIGVDGHIRRRRTPGAVEYRVRLFLRRLWTAVREGLEAWRMFGEYPYNRWQPWIVNSPWPVPKGQVEAVLNHEYTRLFDDAEREHIERVRHDAMTGPLDKQFAAEHQARYDAYMAATHLFYVAGNKLGVVLRRQKHTEVK